MRRQDRSGYQSAADFLKKSQANDGSFSAASGPASRRSSPRVCCVLAAPRRIRSLRKRFEVSRRNRHEDGGIYQKGGNHKNYETCLAIVAFKKPTRISRYDKLLANAEKFVKKEQWDEDEGKSAGRSELRRRGIRLLEPARSVEHQFPDRCASLGRPRRRRSGDSEGADLRFALPEPGND